jgi:hypothetical protein
MGFLLLLNSCIVLGLYPFLVIDENSHNDIWMNVGWQKGDRINGFGAIESQT